MPRSGRSSNGSVSHFAPPTAPNSTASLATAWARVSSVSGTPDFVERGAADQTLGDLEAGDMAPVEELDHAQRLAHDFRADAVARQHQHLAVGRAGLRHGSGPGPDHAELPRTRQPRLLLIGADFRALLLGQADVVEPVQAGNACGTASISKCTFSPSGRVIVCVSRSIVITALAPFLASSISSSTISFGSAIGRMPFLKQLL